MPIRTNIWDLKGHYELTNSSQNAYVGSNLLFSFGYNDRGQLGQNNLTNYSSPVQVPGTTWSSLSVGRGTKYKLATKTDGTLWSWGYNIYGQLGQNNTTQYSSPIQIPGTTWSSIATGGNFSLATKTDGTLWAWGQNYNGCLGQNDRTYYRISPRQIPGNTWKNIANNSEQASIATKTDGTLWTWGANQYGQLGQNNRTYRSSPTQIPGTTWNLVFGSGTSNLYAIKTDGTLWGWGYNYYGQLGQNSTTPFFPGGQGVSSPVQVPGTTWSSMSAGSDFVTAIKTDGTLWSWGNNGSTGRLGLNDTISRSSPIQIPGNTWRSVSSGASHVLDFKTDGTLWVWGQNSNGQLGQNNRTYYSSPIQIPGTTWSSVTATDNSTFITQTQ